MATRQCYQTKVSQKSPTTFLFNLIIYRFEKRIYIPLPGPDARRRMFEIHIGDTPNQLTPKDFRTLAERTDGYSGSDISTVVRDALMQPIRKVMSATHFKNVADPTSDSPELTKWTPCSPGDPHAVEKTWQEVESNELLEPPLRLADFLLSLEATPPTVTESDIKRNEDWTKEAGRWLLCIPLICNVNFRVCRSPWRIILGPTLHFSDSLFPVYFWSLRYCYWNILKPNVLRNCRAISVFVHLYGYYTRCTIESNKLSILHVLCLVSLTLAKKVSCSYTLVIYISK
jgi:hypothetical protein